METNRLSSEKVVTTLFLYGILIVPIQIELDDVTTEKMQKQILYEVEKYKAKGVIIELSHVDIIDSYIARILIDTFNMLQLVGVRTMFVGIQPEVALTLAQMGLPLDKIDSALTIEMAVENLKGKGDNEGL